MKKILVVDDSEGWRKYHKQRLEKFDVELTICECARDAYDKVFENVKTPYDLIITDLQMEEDFSPLYAGEWLVERVKELNSRIPTLLVSATFNIRTIADNTNSDYLPKALAINNPEAYDIKIKEYI